MPMWKEAVATVIGTTLLLILIYDFPLWNALGWSSLVTASVMVLLMLYQFLRRPRS